MGITAFNLRRRQAAAENEAKASAETVADLESKEETVNESAIAAHPVVKIANTATRLKDLTDVPDVGQGAAKLILGNRPDGGYVDFAQLKQINQALGDHPYNVDWDAIEEYTG